MADTLGLMKTRGLWTDAVAAGETDLPHAEWYEKIYLKPPEKPKGIIDSRVLEADKKKG